MTTLILLAQEGGAPAGPGDQPPMGTFVPLLLLLGIVFYFVLIRPQRKEQSKRQNMLSAVKKTDRVVTIGGIYGVVTNVDREADEVTLKIDESTNTKLRVTLGSIARIQGDESSGEASSNK